MSHSVREPVKGPLLPLGRQYLFTATARFSISVLWSLISRIKFFITCSYGWISLGSTRLMFWYKVLTCSFLPKKIEIKLNQVKYKKAKFQNSVRKETLKKPRRKKQQQQKDRHGGKRAVRDATALFFFFLFTTEQNFIPATPPPTGPRFVKTDKNCRSSCCGSVGYEPD